MKKSIKTISIIDEVEDYIKDVSDLLTTQEKRLLRDFANAENDNGVSILKIESSN